MTRKEAEGMLYRREGSRYWYFSYFDKDAGRRIRQSTKTDDRNEAVEFVMAYVEKRLDDIRCRNLKELIMLFADAKSNPRFIEAQADGGHYGYGHAVHIAGTAKALVRLLEHKAPRYLRLPLRSHRLSGAADQVNVLLSRTQLGAQSVHAGDRLAVEGEVRSFQGRVSPGPRLDKPQKPD